MSAQSTSGIPIPKRHHDAGPKRLFLAGALDENSTPDHRETPGYPGLCAPGRRRMADTLR